MLTAAQLKVYQNLFDSNAAIKFIEIGTHRLCGYDVPYNPNLFAYEDRMLDGIKCKCLVLKNKNVWELFESDMPLLYCIDRNMKIHIVSNISYMFADCIKLRYVHCGKMNTSKVTRMDFMFADCLSLTSVDCYGWNTRMVYSTSNMFANCSKLGFAPIVLWNTDSLEIANRMFYKCVSMNHNSMSIKHWHLNKLKDISEMFKDTGATILKIDISKVPDTCNKTDVF